MSVDSLKREIAQIEAALTTKKRRLADVRAAIARGDEEATETVDVFPVAVTKQGRSVVKGWNIERMRLARESRGLTRRELARLCAANGAREINDFRLRLYEQEPKAAPTIAEAQLLAHLTHYPAGFFVQPIDAVVTDFGEQLRQALNRKIIICDVCEQELGDDDSRAYKKCAACHLDLCEMHAHAYTPTVTLPHGSAEKPVSVEVTAAHYCPKCYRRYVSRGLQTQNAKAAKRRATLPSDIGGLWAGKVNA